MRRRFGFIICISAAILLTVTVSASCGKGLDAQEILSRAEETAATTNSFETVMTASIIAEAIGASLKTKLTMDMDGSGKIDIRNHRAYMQAEMNMEMPGSGIKIIETEGYMADGWQYIKIPMPPAGDKWTKIKMPDSRMLNRTELGSQFELLKDATGITLLKSDKVNGIACYVIEAKPDAVKLLKQMLNQSQTQYSLGLRESDFAMFDISKILKGIVIREWISRDTFRIMKAEAELSLEMSAADIGSTSGEFDSMTFKMTTAVTFQNYDKAVNITIPQEALDAVETEFQ